jgi:hypothetical protein
MTELSGTPVIVGGVFDGGGGADACTVIEKAGRLVVT